MYYNGRNKRKSAEKQPNIVEEIASNVYNESLIQDLTEINQNTNNNNNNMILDDVD